MAHLAELSRQAASLIPTVGRKWSWLPVLAGNLGQIDSLFFPAPLDVILSFEVGVDSQPVPAVISNPLLLLCCQALYLPDLSVISVDVVELHLKRRMLLDEDNGLDVSVLKSFVVADVKHGH